MNFTKYTRWLSINNQLSLAARNKAWIITFYNLVFVVEEVNERKEGYVTCRLSNNMVVHIPGDASMIGSYKPILLEQCRGFYFFGRIADTDSAADPQ